MCSKSEKEPDDVRAKWEERTWEAGSEVLHQGLLADRLVGGIHSGDGQAQDFP